MPGAGNEHQFLPSNAIKEAINRAGPAVVQVSTEHWSRIPTPRPKGIGSGFIIDGDGYILTNARGLDPETDFIINMADGRRAKARYVGAEPGLDLGLLLADGEEDLPQSALGDSDDMAVGDIVIAMGNARGLDWTASTGIVSAVQRSFISARANLDAFIQTDASINPGNAGGPLVNLKGEVVALTTGFFSRGRGLGWAIPIKLALQIVDELKAYGRTQQRWLGIEGQNENIGAEWAEWFELPARQGTLVTRVVADSPAHRAGLQVFDLIIGCNDETIETVMDLRDLMGKTDIGERVLFKVLRGSEVLDILVEIGELPRRSGRRRQ